MKVNIKLQNFPVRGKSVMILFSTQLVTIYENW